MKNRLGVAHFRKLQFFVVIGVLWGLALSTKSTSAFQNPLTPAGMRRDEMMTIAERYATYKWQAVNDTNQYHSGNVDTPDLDWCKLHKSPNAPTWGCWRFGNTFTNIGIPYFWGGATAVEDDPNDDFPELYLAQVDKWTVPVTHERVGYFGQMIAAGAPAGDVMTEREGGIDRVGSGAGVDCIGFVGQVWRRGTRLFMPQISEAPNELGRPIRFKDLQPGDIIRRYVKDGMDHVIIFKQWLNYIPGNGNPIPAGTSYGATGGTTFQVYEAALGPRKVVESTYMLMGIESAELPFRHGPRQQTDKVTIRRLNYCDYDVRLDPNDEDLNHDGCYQDTEYADQNDPKYINPRDQYFDYYPYTYINPIDAVLVIDRSPSMNTVDPGSGQTRIAMATEAAKMFIDLMKPGDKVGIVVFSDTTQVLHQLDVIDTEDEKAVIKQKLNNISLYSGTSIGQGLVTGQQQLNSFGSGDPNRLMLLLSDGDENVCPCWRNVMTPNNNFDPIYSIGLGTNYSQALLGWISDSTGGIYRDIYPYNPLIAKEVFNDLYLQTNGEVVIQTLSGSVPALQTVEQTVNIDAVSSMTVSLNWPGSDLDLVLVRPDGQEINPNVAESDRDITYTSGSTYEFYTVFAPEPGNWKLKIFGKSISGVQEDYVATVAADDGMVLSVNADKESYLVGNPVKITAFVEDGSLSNPLGGENVRDAIMQVTARDPAHNEFSYQLYDDGLHGDSEQNDGIYANTFNNTSLEGNYEFDVYISGTGSWYGYSFTREKSLAVYVSDPPTVINSQRVSGSPTNYYSVDYTVTFSQPVIGVDTADFILTTEGVSGGTINTVTAVNPTRVWTGTEELYYSNTYAVTVHAGDSNGTVRLDLNDNDTIIAGDNDPLGSVGLGNGNFTAGESYNIDKSLISTVVTKLEDTNDGMCNADCSLREAIATASPGDTITFNAALSGEIIHLVSTLTLSKNVTVDGSALTIPVTISGDTNDDGTGDVRVFYVNSGITANLNRLVVSKGYSSDYGGGLFGQDATVTVTNSAFYDNLSVLEGGGIYSSAGTLTIINSTFSNNNSGTAGSWGSGAGIEGSSGTLTVTNSTFSNNSSTHYGGGIHMYGGTLTITNSTISDNSAAHGGNGIYLDSYARLNYANTIISSSLSGGDCILRSSYLGTNTKNLVKDGSCSASLSGDPNLAPLTDNGGVTRTMALLSGSPAIDAGDDAACAMAPVNNLDQRGVIRPQRSHCDIGAFEAEVSILPPIVLSSKVANAHPGNVNFTVTFSKNVTGVDSSDFILTTADAPGAAISSATGSGATYTVSVNTGSGDGTIRLDVLNDGTIVDTDAHSLESAFTSGETYTIDHIAPTVLSSIVTSVSLHTTNFTVTFSEDVTGVDARDFTLTATNAPNAAINSVTGSGAIYIVSVYMDAEQGTVRLDVLDDNIILDYSSNPLENGFTNGETYRRKIVSKLADTNDGLCDADCSLREALTATVPGDTITFNSVLSGGTIHLASTLILSRNVTIDGSELTTPITISGDTNGDTVGDVQVFNVNEEASATLHGLTISKGKASEGGGIHNLGTLVISDCILSGNSTNDLGGAIYNDGELTITDSAFTGNSATYDGGGIYNEYNYGHLTIDGSTFSNNSSQYDGGAIENEGQLTVTKSTFSDNTSSSDGGGILNDNVMTVASSAFSNNSARYGGGIENNYHLTITSSTFLGNSSTSEGGGIANYDQLTIANSTFSANVSNSFGGGIGNYDQLTIINSTLSGNSSDSHGGGIYNDSYATLNFANTIMANSNSGGDCFSDGVITTNTKNLIEDGSCSASLSGDPHLDVLSDNGGVTMTMALLTGSPAIDTGDDTTCAATLVSNLDQRGISRPLGVHCDIGAYEFSDEAPPTPTFTPTNTPTFTPTYTPTYTATNTATFTPTSTYTSTPTPTFTPTNTPTFTPTPTSTVTLTSTFTPTNAVTSTSTFTSTATQTLTPTATNTATATASANSITIQPNASDGQETYISSANTTTNYGAATIMGIGEDNGATNKTRSLIKFDLSLIPSNATITSATLSIWTSADHSTNDRTIRVYRLKNSWNESEVHMEQVFESIKLANGGCFWYQ